MSDAFSQLEPSVLAALRVYANVHRGAGHPSRASTELYEHARAVVLSHLGLTPASHMVLFCPPLVADHYLAQLAPDDVQVVSSEALGLHLGLRALAVRRRALGRLTPCYQGGGMARLVGDRWVVRARLPARLEAGTPAVIHAVALARALQLVDELGPGCFRDTQPWLSIDDVLRPRPHEGLDGLAGHELLARLKAGLVRQRVTVPTAHGSASVVPLDHAASTPALAPAWEAARRAWRLDPEARPALAREAAAACARFLRAPDHEYEVLFTAHTTEAINLAAENLRLEAAASSAPLAVVNTILEHNSNELPWRALPGVAHLRLGADRDGFVDLAALETLLATPRPEGPVRLVAVSGASNVLGTCNPVQAICRIAHAHGAAVLVDAAQLVAHHQVDMAGWDVDYLAFSGHKIYAPFGAGALVARRRLLRFDAARLAQIRRAGDENTSGLAALAVALDLLGAVGMDVVCEDERALTKLLLERLSTIRGIKVHGIASPEHPRFADRIGVVAFDLGKTMPSTVSNALAADAGVATRWGCHCAHLLIKHQLGIGPFIQGLQRAIVTVFPTLELPGMARVSLGLASTAEDVDVLAASLERLVAGGRRDKKKQAERRMGSFVDGVVSEVYGTARA